MVHTKLIISIDVTSVPSGLKILQDSIMRTSSRYDLICIGTLCSAVCFLEVPYDLVVKIEVPYDLAVKI